MSHIFNTCVINSEIEESVRAVWAATPDHLRYDRQPNNDGLRHDRRPNNEFHHGYGWLTIVYLYLNYLYTCFLLQRALIKHTNTGHAALCDVSRRVLTIVISITSQRNPMVDLDRHYSWIVCSLPLSPESKRARIILLVLSRLLHTVFQVPVFFSSSSFTNPMSRDPIPFPSPALN